MKKSYFVFALLVTLVVGAYAAWNIAYPSGTWRYKMTVSVETPEGIKTGSAVREIGFHSEPSILPGQGGGLTMLFVRERRLSLILGQEGFYLL